MGARLKAAKQRYEDASRQLTAMTAEERQSTLGRELNWVYQTGIAEVRRRRSALARAAKRTGMAVYDSGSHFRPKDDG